jgi:MHS family proline/betaine transporter-like MFS transporter
LKTPTAAVSGSDWRVILLASLGGALEFYDFVIYSQFAQYIGRNFYPNDDPTVSLIVSFSVFAVGYFARPLGGIFFGHIGDRIGRRRVLIITILTMSAATAGIGLLPTYAAWGITASVLLVALRIIQGFCLGGELPGAIAYVVETAPRRSGFSVGVIFFCVNTGVALAALLNLVVHETLTVEEIASWGWRIGFLVGGVLGIISFFLRLRLEESREFARIRALAGASAVPFADLMRTHPTAVAVGVAILAVTAGFNGLLFAMPAFLPQTMGYEAVTAIEAQNVALAILSVGLLLVAWFSDRVSRKALALTGTSLLLVLAWPFFKAAQDQSANLLSLFALAGAVASICAGTVIAIAADLFPTRIRFSGVAMSFNLSFTFFSGLAPVVATLLARNTGVPATAAYYMIGCALITFIAALVMHRYDGRILADLAESPPTADRSGHAAVETRSRPRETAGEET